MDIPLFTRKLLEEFDRMRGKDAGKQFWDMIVVTASDEEQAKAYQLQILHKQQRQELPIGIEYKVYFDSPGAKIGCGGSTMYVISKLHKLLGEDLWTKKILLINAGGQSQRLPSSSVLGKIFMALPIRNPMYQLFEFKLACYLPFLKTMKPGIFHAAADTVEVYDLGSENCISFDKPGFTALAHPSSLEIGSTHGVYILEETHKLNDGSIASMRNCLEVLQKPSIQRMEEKNAIVVDSKGNKIVYTDSCFFFDHDVSKKLLDCYTEEPIQCEIDSYGDFLQGLGPRATDSYTTDVKNVSTVDPNLIHTRQRVFKCLRNTQLNIVALEASKFYHFGTMPEYLENLTNDPVIAAELGYQKEAFSVFDNGQHFFQGDSKDKAPAKRIKIIHNEGCLMHSFISNSDSFIKENSVLEYCDLEMPVNVGKNCILSNCQLSLSQNKKSAVNIPDGTFLHTVWIKYKEQNKAVTIAFGIGDNIKKKVEKGHLDQLKLFGKSFPSVLKAVGITDMTFSEEATYNLWTAKMFPACDTMSASFCSTYSMFCDESSEKRERIIDKELYSLCDIVQYKDVDTMMKYRKELYTKIACYNHM